MRHDTELAVVQNTRRVAREAALFDSEAGGKTDIWFLQNGRIKRLTDFSTAIAHPGLAPNGVYGVAADW